jgi:hypothetical protein
MRKSEFALRFVAISVVLALGQSLSGCGGGSSGSSSSPSAIAPVANACPREAAGSVVQNPPDLFSRNGVLTVTFSTKLRLMRMAEIYSAS